MGPDEAPDNSRNTTIGKNEILGANNEPDYD